MVFTPPSTSKFALVLVFVLLVAFKVGVLPVQANNTVAIPPFSQDWTNAGLITINDDWSGVPSIIGYRGDGLTISAGVDPQTILDAD